MRAFAIGLAAVAIVALINNQAAQPKLRPQCDLSRYRAGLWVEAPPVPA